MVGTFGGYSRCHGQTGIGQVTLCLVFGQTGQVAQSIAASADRHKALTILQLGREQADLTQPEQIARPFLRACTATSSVGRGVPSAHFTFPYTKDLKGSTRLRIVFSCILWWPPVRWLVW